MILVISLEPRHEREAGYLADAVPDGHVFSETELGTARYRFVQTALLPVEAAALKAGLGVVDAAPLGLEALAPGRVHRLDRRAVLAALRPTEVR